MIKARIWSCKFTQWIKTMKIHRAESPCGSWSMQIHRALRVKDSTRFLQHCILYISRILRFKNNIFIFFKTTSIFFRNFSSCLKIFILYEDKILDIFLPNCLCLCLRTWSDFMHIWFSTQLTELQDLIYPSYAVKGTESVILMQLCNYDNSRFTTVPWIALSDQLLIRYDFVSARGTWAVLA